MKIYSWNIWFRNKNFDRAFEYIKNLDFDILCLQEVPEDFLKRLQTLPHFLCFAPEGDRLLDGEKTTHFLVIVSKYPIQKFESIPLPFWDMKNPLRARLFVTGMVWLGLWSWGLGSRHALYADIETGKGLWRVFNLHLALVSPKERKEEFETSMTHRDKTLLNIVAGDFNIVESPRVSMLNWILGGRFTDALFWNRERKDFESRFAIHGVKNPLRGKVTHRFSASQLDHILVPVALLVSSATVSEDAYGSDHRPVFVKYKVD